MSITVNIGFSQKLGQPDYGSIGASYHVECELDGPLSFADPALFHAKVSEMYAACATVVREELAQRTAIPGQPARGRKNGVPNSSGTTDSEAAPAGNGRLVYPATVRQLDYLEQLSQQITGLGSSDLPILAQRVCGKSLAELSRLDASTLIDTLKAINDGRWDAETVRDGEAG